MSEASAPAPRASEPRSGQPRVGRAIAQNTALIAVCRLATAVSALVVVPVVVSTLGVSGYGVWEAMLAVASLSLMFQGAISSTAIWQASAAYGAGRVEDVHRVARIGISATLLILLLVVPPVWVLRGTIVEFLNVNEMLRAQAAAILPLLVAVLILGGVTESLSAIVSAFQRAGLTSVTAAAGLLGNYIVVLVGLHQGYGLWSLLFGYVASLSVQVIALYCVVCRLSGRPRLTPALPTVTEVRSMGSYYGLILIGFVSAALRDQTDKIVLAAMASPAWVGYYAIASRLGALVIEVSRFFYVPMMAAVASLNAAGNWTAIRRVFDRMMTAGALAACAVAVIVASHYDRLLVLWIGEFPPSVAPMLLLLLAGNTTAVVLTGTGTALCRAVSRVGIETTYVLVNLVANVILTIWLVSAIGPMGTVAASAITWAGSAVVFVVVLHRRLGLPTRGTFAAVRAMAAMVVTVGAFRVMSQVLPVAETRTAALVSMCWLGPLTLGVYGLCAALAGVFGRSEIKEAIGHLADGLSWRGMKVAAVRAGE
jgi:O-antigen/teichoic acid export membrane protein